MMQGAANPFERALFAIPSLLEDEVHLQHRGRFFNITMALVADNRVYYLPFSEGRLPEIVAGPALMRPPPLPSTAPPKAGWSIGAPCPVPVSTISSPCRKTASCASRAISMR
jgi:hypothetical protein